MTLRYEAPSEEKLRVVVVVTQCFVANFTLDARVFTAMFIALFR